MVDVLLTGIGELQTITNGVVPDGAVAIDGDQISYAGPESDAPDVGHGSHIRCEGKAVLPGFVDAHTHLVFAGDRAHEFTARLGGASYREIAEMGGGILSTVGATRDSSEEELFALAAGRIRRMMAGGTTTVEVKSGYGLDPATELRILRVARRLGRELPVTVKTTFLGAHSIPPEFKTDRDGYVDLVVEEMIPAAADLADNCDVFVEEGVFDVEEARRIFSAAEALGMKSRVHAEQLTD